VADEEVLRLDYDSRTHIRLRMDADGGTLDDLNWCLGAAVIFIAYA
jgi:hypothetical protein